MTKATDRVYTPPSPDRGCQIRQTGLKFKKNPGT